MKQLVRAVTLVLLVGGWGLAGAAVHVVRTPNNFVVVPKERLSPYDTYVDTRKWTVAEDQVHPSVVAGVLRLGRPDLLRHTLPANAADPDATLAAIAAEPRPSTAGANPASVGGVIQQAEGQIKAAVNIAKTQVGKL